MADQTATFAIELEDKASGAATSAAQGLKRLRDQIDADKRALSQMQAAMKNLQGGTVVNIKQFKQLQEQILAKKASVAQAQSSFLALGGTFTKTGGSSSSFQARLAALSKQSAAMPGPLGGLVARFQSLAAVVGGGAMAAGILAIVAALALLVVGTVAAINALARYGVAQADVARSELLRLEGLTKIRNWYGLAAGNAGEMQQAIDKVSASSALGRDKVAGYSEQLYRMGLRGDNLSAALEGVAIKASVQGEAQANMFANWAAGAALTGGSVRRLADDVKTRLGGIAEKQMLSLTVQAQKQQEAFAMLFSGLNIEPFLKAKKAVNDMFSQSTASGRALKQLLTVLIQPLLDAVTAALPIVKRFFQGLILGGQRIVIAILEVRASFRKTFGGGGDGFKGIDLAKAALYAGSFAAAALAAGLTAVAVAALVISAPFLLAVAAIWAVINTARLLYQLWKAIDWTDLGRSIWQGIVAGLKSGAKWVVDAVTNIGKAASTAFKKALGIASPSKAFQHLGAAIPAGVTVGVEQGTPAARRAVSAIVQAPAVPTARSAVRDSSGGAPRVTEAAAPAERTSKPGRATKSGAAGTVTINELHVHAKSDKPRELALDIKRELEAILEGVAIQLGAPIAGAT